jgi:hypothetical protein
LIEGVFDETIFDEAAFQVDEVAEIQESGTLNELQASFVQDHGPLRLMPHELAARRELWVKVLKDWVRRHREKKRQRALEVLMLYSLVTDGAVQIT